MKPLSSQQGQKIYLAKSRTHLFFFKDFICREDKRKTAYWGMQGDPETSGPLQNSFVGKKNQKNSASEE
jgi:hypothetical protein